MNNEPYDPFRVLLAVVTPDLVTDDGGIEEQTPSVGYSDEGAHDENGERAEDVEGLDASPVVDPRLRHPTCPMCRAPFETINTVPKYGDAEWCRDCIEREARRLAAAEDRAAARVTECRDCGADLDDGADTCRSCISEQNRADDMIDDARGAEVFGE